MSLYWYGSYLFHLRSGLSRFYTDYRVHTEHFSTTKCNSSARARLMCWRQKKVPRNKSSAARIRQGLFFSDNTSCDYTECFETQNTVVSSRNPWDKMKCIKHVDFINLPLLALGQRYIHCSAQQALFPLHCYSTLWVVPKWMSAKAACVWNQQIFAAEQLTCSSYSVTILQRGGGWRWKGLLEKYWNKVD